MPDQYITPQISNVGVLEQSIAASGEMQLTGTDRELIKRRVGDVDTSRSFTEVVSQLMDKTQNIAKTEAKADKKFELDVIKKRVKLHKPSSAIIAQPMENPEIEHNDHENHPQTKPQLEDGYERSKDLVPKLLKELCFAYGKKLLGADEDLKIILSELLNIAPENKEKIESVRSQVKAVIQNLIAHFIQESLLIKLTDLKPLTSTVLRSKIAHRILGYYFGREKQERLEDLFALAKELKLDLSELLQKWDLESISISEEGLSFSYMLTHSQDEKAALLKALRFVSSKAIFILDPEKKKELKEKIKEINIKLLTLGTSIQEINAIIEEAKKIAWLKSVLMLKKLHFKRLLSTTREEFEKYSKFIMIYTVSVRSLGIRVNSQGTKLVEASLEVTSYKSAKYKLELLRSMQNLSRSEEREKNIEWLNGLVSELGKKVHLYAR